MPLCIGCKSSFPVDSANYHLDDEQLKPGKYALQAGFVGKGVSEDGANLDMKGIALMPYRLGKVTSALKYPKQSFQDHHVGPDKAANRRLEYRARGNRLLWVRCLNCVCSRRRKNGWVRVTIGNTDLIRLLVTSLRVGIVSHDPNISCKFLCIPNFPGACERLLISVKSPRRIKIRGALAPTF